MEIRLLRAFLTVTDLRHFGRAAEALHLSQPALSKQIVALETSLGGRLFERGRHGAELTAFGEVFLADAQALVRDADDVLTRAREASSGRRGHLRIGLCLSTLTLAPPLIAAYRAQHPQIGVSLNDLSSAEQTRRLFAGKLDVGFLRLPASAGLSAFAVIDETLAIAVPQQAKWKRLPARLEELNELGFISLARNKGPGTAAMIDAWCAERGFAPRVIQQADDFQSVLAGVAAGVGVAFVPSRAEHLLRDAKVLRLKDASAQWRVGLAWQTQREDPVVMRFVDYVRAATKHGAQA
ncbi:LysR substrate-binding domain-containing protein [Burkholderia sp. Ac-20365]|jgi:DNA-binding transcriptional LysR family regulator|uniref:LysR family transcriptional regulator n=1 Tax=Burkholderia sp. Ac-20365 TaxID=2703897 RepID=UPI00197B899C|nr:LysR substrate-binding domain-containing protein [Burkholderia sp. Ac-20365]MBN3766047.1 LysR family transcriptional regulator [Burkholderia sp. Ac-20365]